MGKIDGKDGFAVTANTKICDQHFLPEDIVKVPGGKRWRLKDGAIPIKVGQPLRDERKRKPPAMRYEPNIRLKKPKVSSTSTPHLLQPKSLLCSALAVVSATHKALMQTNKLTKCKLEQTEKDLYETMEKLQQRSFGSHVIRDDEQCQHYTGFPDFKRFEACLNFLSVGSNGENVRTKGTSEQKGSGRSRSLSSEEQFLILLMKLRNGFSNLHLGWLFHCDGSTITRLLISWVNYVYLKFSSLPIWPSREEVNVSMPDVFKEKFPNTRVIIDCTEIAVEAPESLHTRSVFYSDYKHHNTYKALIGITPAGGLSFVSELFPGSVSDREIVCRCGILNPQFWNKNDEIMADKGFTIRDLLDPMGVKLNIPIFLEDKAQFQTEQVVVNQRIASVRIHVERYISRIKNFHIFDRPLPLTMHGSANQIFTICSFLVMFQNPIVSV